MVRAILHHGSRIVAAAACGYLGFLAATMLLGLPLLAASAISGSGGYHVFASGGLVQVLGRPIPDASTTAQVLYRLGPALLAIITLAVGPFVVRLVNAWFSIGMLHLVFWTGVAFSQSALAAAWGRGPVSDLIRFLGISQIGTISLQVPLAMAAGLFAGLMVYFCLINSVARGGGAMAAARELGWRFVIPVAGLALALPSSRLDSWQRFLGVPFAPAIFAVCIAALALIWRDRNASPVEKPAPAGTMYAIGLAGIAGVATWGLSNWNSAPVNRPATELRASAHWEIQFEQGEIAAADQKSLLAAADRRVVAAAARLGIVVPTVPLRTSVRSTEDQRRWFRGRGRDPRQRGEDDKGAFEYRLMPSGTLPDTRIEPRLLMAAAWGDPGYEPLANAIARFAVGDFLGRPLDEYARRIACEERPYELADVLDLRNEYLSPIVRDALGGAWIESLGASSDTLKRIYAYRLTPGNTTELAAMLGSSWDGLESDWKRYLTGGADCAPLPPEPPLQRIAWHKGVAFSHEMGGGWGYGSDSAAAQLARIRSIGANSVAIIPYAFTRAPEVASISFRTDETDERIIRTIEQAHRAGLAAVLKPQIWARRFTGDIKFSSRGEFETWFAQYRRWLLHFARLGALYRAEMLVIGTELGGMTGYESAWRGLIGDVRAVYPGELAYASNWGEEFESVRFWDALDYVGVNFYFPLTDGDGVKPSAVRLEELARMVESVASRYRKRVLFTEVGYPSVATAAQRPWEETAAALDLDLQRECYEEVFRTFSNRPWFAGFYWWKWPSHGSGGAFDESFSPLGKPALDVLTKWYRGEGGPIGNNGPAIR